MSETTVTTTDESNKEVACGVLIACLEAAGFYQYQKDDDRTRYLQEGGTLEAVVNDKLPTYVFLYDPAGAQEDRWLLEIARDSKQFDLMIEEFEEGIRQAEQEAEEDAAAEMELDLGDDTDVLDQYMELDEIEVTELSNLLYGNAGSIQEGLAAMCLDAECYDIDMILEQLWDQEHLTECVGCTFWCLEDELDDDYHCENCR